MRVLHRLYSCLQSAIVIGVIFHSSHNTSTGRVADLPITYLRYSCTTVHVEAVTFPAFP